MQQLQVSLTIPVPDGMVLVHKVELEDLKKIELAGVYWNMKDLEKRVNKKQDWIKSNILYRTKFKEVLDIENGGFVFYPKGSGQSWSFQANEMANFLDRNFSRIFKG